MPVIRFAALLAWLVSLGGAAETKAAKPTTAQARTSVASSAASDAVLERTIRQKFSKSKLAADNLQVHVQGGVATIEGLTNVVQRKGAATRMARTAGARQVVNKVVVSQQAREKASANLAQGRRRAQIKRSEVTARSER